MSKIRSKKSFDEINLSQELKEENFSNNPLKQKNKQG